MSRGNYPIVVSVTDKTLLVQTEKELILTVVDFFPDEYEARQDNDAKTGKSVKPGDSRQNHTFDQPGDRDFMKLDLTGLSSGDVIEIRTESWKTESKTSLDLFDAEGKPVSTATLTNNNGYSEAAPWSDE